MFAVAFPNVLTSVPRAPAPPPPLPNHGESPPPLPPSFPKHFPPTYAGLTLSLAILLIIDTDEPFTIFNALNKPPAEPSFPPLPPPEPPVSGENSFGKIVVDVAEFPPNPPPPPFALYIVIGVKDVFCTEIISLSKPFCALLLSTVLPASVKLPALEFPIPPFPTWI